jgi:hypothetical protein
LPSPRFAFTPADRHLDLNACPDFSCRVQPVLTTRHVGIKVGEALFSDGLVARFRVLSRDPVSVHVLGDQALPAHERAVVEWLAQQHSPVAA